MRELELQYHMDREGQELAEERDARRSARELEARAIMMPGSGVTPPLAGLFAGPRPQMPGDDDDLGPWRPHTPDMMSLLQKGSHRKGEMGPGAFLSPTF